MFPRVLLFLAAQVWGQQASTPSNLAAPADVAAPPADAVKTKSGLITKVMFDHNPRNEFFVEESFPLDWMYPHLTPFGIIMKINREPLRTLPKEVFERDHEFWTKYSERLRLALTVSGCRL